MCYAATCKYDLLFKVFVSTFFPLLICMHSMVCVLEILQQVIPLASEETCSLFQIISLTITLGSKKVLKWFYKQHA